MIPPLQDGVLPEGIYECTIEEVASFFGKFQRTDKRQKLTQNLRRYIEDARRSEIATAVIVNGSYVTAKDEPDDIDVILALRSDFDVSQELRPFEHNIQSYRSVRRLYGFDVFSARDGSLAYQEYVDLFHKVNLGDPGLQTDQVRKGVLRINL
jgi:hypothetical protein